MPFQKGVAQRIGFTLVDSGDHSTPTVPTNAAAQISKDGAAFTATTNSVVSVGNGYCYVDLTATEMDADVICLRVTSDNCDEYQVTIYPDADWTAERASYLDNIAFGTGVHSVELGVKDDSGDPVPNARVTIKNIGTQTTGADGKCPVAWGLDAGTYTVTLQAGTGFEESNPYTLVVDSNGNVTTPSNGFFEVTALALPTPSSPDGIVLWNTEVKADAGDVPFGDGVMQVRVFAIDDSGRVGSQLERYVIGTSTTTDSNGQWSIEIARALATAECVIEVEKQYTDASGVTRVIRERATLQEPTGSQLCWADLEPERI